MDPISMEIATSPANSDPSSSLSLSPPRLQQPRLLREPRTTSARRRQLIRARGDLVTGGGLGSGGDEGGGGRSPTGATWDVEWGLPRSPLGG